VLKLLFVMLSGHVGGHWWVVTRERGRMGVS
jgi:hypothetical protein